jgi:hypothetical protein
MFRLKPLSRTAVSAALEKAERYRLLNEPTDAESICRDVLDVEPENQAALVNLVLALTDQFAVGLTDRLREAKAAAARLTSGYEQAYYSGIICERAAKSHHRRGTPASGNIAYELLRQAMSFYETAERDRPPDNDDALLRWNTCARIIMRHPEIKPADEADTVHLLE